MAVLTYLDLKGTFMEGEENSEAKATSSWVYGGCRGISIAVLPLLVSFEARGSKFLYSGMSLTSAPNSDSGSSLMGERRLGL
jgi:hypothetical protein